MTPRPLLHPFRATTTRDRPLLLDPSKGRSFNARGLPVFVVLSPRFLGENIWATNILLAAQFCIKKCLAAVGFVSRRKPAPKGAGLAGSGAGRVSRAKSGLPVRRLRQRVSSLAVLDYSRRLFVDDFFQATFYRRLFKATFYRRLFKTTFG